MGFIKHDAIVVTGSYGDYLQRAHQRAISLGLKPTGITEPVTNGYQSFLVPPDGSKEGWDESDAAEEARTKLIDWLESEVHEDGSGPLEWIAVSYGWDPDEARITHSPFSPPGEHSNA